MLLYHQGRRNPSYFFSQGLSRECIKCQLSTTHKSTRKAKAPTRRHEGLPLRLGIWWCLVAHVNEFDCEFGGWVVDQNPKMFMTWAPRAAHHTPCAKGESTRGILSALRVLSIKIFSFISRCYQVWAGCLSATRTLVATILSWSCVPRFLKLMIGLSSQTNELH